MRFWESIAGTYLIEVTSADICGLLARLNNAGYSMYDITTVNELKIHMRIYRHKYNALCVLFEKWGVSYKILKKEGIFWSIKSLKKRKLLLAGLTLVILVSLFLPTRILFVRVEGNHQLPAKFIIENARECGIKFGASRRDVRSEKVKNALLSNMNQLKWAGVNTSGCVAIISVEERSAVTPEVTKSGIASIIASQDGIISEISVTKGNALCKVGEAVKKGQILISGYTDCGILVKGERACGEVFAETLRKAEAVTMANYKARTEKGTEKHNFSIKIGKNIIQLYKRSGIWDTTCVKMYSEKYLTLPGGYQLPISIIKQTYIPHQTEEIESDIFAPTWFENTVGNYVKSQMISGEIKHVATKIEQQNKTFKLLGYYACKEFIGEVRNEEFIDNNEGN